MMNSAFKILAIFPLLISCASSPTKLYAYTKVLGHEAICQKVERTACGMELSECVGTPLTFSCVHEVIMVDITHTDKVLAKPEVLHEN